MALSLRLLSGMGLCLLGALLAANATEPSARETFHLSKTEQRLLDLTNGERKQNDLPPLVPNRVLFKVARAHAANMARQDKLAHDLDGKSPRQRVTEAGYPWHFTGENIAYGEVDLEDIVKGWMDSPKHRANILNPKYTEIGFGVARSEQGLDYYTQIFGTPKPQP